MRVKIELDTMTDVNEFIAAVSNVEDPVYLIGEHFCVNAKSLLGALYTMEWAEVWCECERDIYDRISKFVI